jgi:hypothetical protein
MPSQISTAGTFGLASLTAWASLASAAYWSACWFSGRRYLISAQRAWSGATSSSSRAAWATGSRANRSSTNMDF